MTYLRNLRGSFEEIDNQLSKTYVEAKGVANTGMLSGEIHKKLLQQWQQGESPLRSVLIIGEAGLGKTECAQQMASRLWKEYDVAATKLLPIYFNIAAYKHKPEIVRNGLLQAVLSDQNLAENSWVHTISALQKDCQEGRVQLVLLIDGFDEGVPIYENFYITNGWGTDWGDLRVVAFSRPSFLMDVPETIDFRSLFVLDPANPTLTFDKIRMCLFDEQDIELYINKYVNQKPPPSLSEEWSSCEKFIDTIKNIPTLSTMITNPFILTQVVEYLPKLVRGFAEDPGYLSTREKIYAAFTKENFRFQSRRIWSSQESVDMLKASHIMTIEELETCMQTYAERVSKYMWHCGEGRLQLFLTDTDTLKDELFNGLSDKKLSEEAKHMLRDNSVMKPVGQTWQPRVHKSTIEYFVSAALFKSRYQLISVQAENPDITLNTHSLRAEPSLIYMLVDMVKTEVGFRAQLIEMVKASKDTIELRVASANALTILVAAKQNVNGEDFSGVSVVGADLTGMIADDTKFIGADLAGCDVRSAWLAHADLTGATLDDVQIEDDREFFHPKQRTISAIAIDRDQNIIYVGDVKGKILAWDLESNAAKSMSWFKVNDLYQKYRRQNHYPSVSKMQLSQDKDILIYTTYATKTSQATIWLRHIESGYLRSMDLKPVSPMKDLEGRTCTQICHDRVAHFRLLPQHPSFMLVVREHGVTILYDIEKQASVRRVSPWAYFDVSPSGNHLVCGVRQGDSIKRHGFLGVIQTKDLLAPGKVRDIKKLEAKTFGTWGPSGYSSQFSPSGQYLFVRSKTNLLFDANHWLLIRSFGVNQTIGGACVNFFPDESCVLTSVDSEHTVWHLETGTRYYVFKSPTIAWGLYDRDVSPKPCIGADNTVWFTGSSILRAKAVAQRYYFQQKIQPVLDQSTLAPFPSSWRHGAVKYKEQRWKHFYNGLRMQFYFLPVNFSGGKANKSALKSDFADRGGEIFKLDLSVEQENGDIIFQHEVLWCCVSLSEREEFFDLRQGVRKDPSAISCLSNSQKIAVAGFDLFSEIFEIYNKLRLDKKIKQVRRFKHDNTIRFYNVDSQTLIREIKPNDKDNHIYNGMFFSADDRWLVTYGDGVRIWEWASKKPANRCLKLDVYVTAAALTKDMQWLVMTTADLSLYAYHIDSGNSCCISGLVSETASIQLGQDDRSFVVWTDGMDEFFMYEIVESDLANAYLRLVTGTYQIDFNCERANLDNAFSNSAKTVGFFRSHGAIGEPNYYDTVDSIKHDELLARCSHTSESIDAYRYSLLNDELPIMYDSWVVTLARHTKVNPEHAFIILEGMDHLGNPLAVRFDMATHTSKMKVKDGYAIACVRHAPQSEQSRYEDDFFAMVLRSNGRSVEEVIRGRSWMITRRQGLFLYNDMHSVEERGLIPYSLFGARNYKSSRKHNCYTFARDQLRKIHRDVIDRDLEETALDIFAVDPRVHLNKPIH